MQTKDAASRFNYLDNQRDAMLDRCRIYAKLTLPYVFPDDTYETEQDTLQLARHSIGAQSVNSLANKMMLALFQPSNPFFRLGLTKEAQNSLPKELASNVDQILANGETEAMAVMARGAYRPALFELMKHLIITGNALPVFAKSGTLSVVSLKDYVVQRSPDGTVIEIVVRRDLAYAALDADAKIAYEQLGGREEDPDAVVSLYHWIKKVPGDSGYTVEQWVEDKHLPAKQFDSKVKNYDDLPWQPQVWVLPTGSHYGVGLVEEYYGDLTALNVYAKSQTDGAALAATWRFMLSESSSMRPEDLANSENGDIISGSPNNLALLTAPVAANVAAIASALGDTAQRVGRGFLTMTAITRDAERVTAEEIRTLAAELETGLGGVYARLAVSLQQPMAHFLFKQIQNSLSETQIQPTIITGMEALSRQVELDKMSRFIQDVVQLASLPENILMWLKQEDIYEFMASGRGLDRGKFIRTEAEVQQMQQQEAQQQLAAQMQTQQIPVPEANK